MFASGAVLKNIETFIRIRCEVFFVMVGGWIKMVKVHL